jgi:hypothetical protein
MTGMQGPSEEAMAHRSRRPAATHVVVAVALSPVTVRG